MTFDATFWVAISFLIFFGALIYLKIPQKVTELLEKMISDIKNEIEESEKLRSESKLLLDKAQTKLETAEDETKKILTQATKDSEKLVIEMNKLSVDSVRKIISTSVDKSKLDTLFQKNLEETKEALKKINS